jgi:flagellar hook assembly protein FlgD
MRKKLISILSAWALFTGLAATASAQQLYVRDIDVKFKDPGNGYCNDVTGADPDMSYLTAGGNVWQNSSLIEFERPRTSYPGGCLGLCAQIVCVSTAGFFGIDELTFEVFKFGAGSNPLDPASTPPIKTISMYNIGTCQSSNNAEYVIGGAGNYYCTPWDGSYNLNGIFGKTNGQFGFRTKVRTNQVSASAGNISIEQTAAFPGQTQVPIQVNVTNIHTIRSSPTVVGRITGVAAQPYNILYRLSKDSLVSISVYDASTAGSLPIVRRLLIDIPRVGEGTPDGTLTNGDFWDGRDDTGNMVAAGNYLARIDAKSNDMWQPPTDLAFPATVQISLDPLQITDVAVRPLGASATDMATISYLLTEAATVYVNIYQPGTQVDYQTGTANTTPLRTFVEQKDRRVSVSTYWDGRDTLGRTVCDGEYVYTIDAYMASSSVFAPGGEVWTKRTTVGTVPVARGNVLALMSPSSTVIGSSPSVAGLDPFYFRYTPSRDTFVTMNVRDMANNIVRHVTTREVRFANFSNREIWDGKKDNGTYVSSGTYLAELITEDPFQCADLKTSTATVQFPVSMFRIVDLKATPLLGGTSDVATISFEMSQPMYMELNVYKTSVTVNPYQIWTPGLNPSLASLPADPVFNAQGMRPGRLRITEYWDGRDSSGLLVPDGRYPFVLVAHTTSPVVTAQTMYASDEAYGYIDVSRGQIIFTMFDVTPSLPTMYNSSDTVKLPPFDVSYAVTRQSSVTVQVLSMESPPRVVANVIAGQIRDGDIRYSDFWDGKDDNGNLVDGGAYNIRVTAQDISSQLAGRATVQLTIDVYPLRIFDVSITPLTTENPAIVSYQVSEPMKVVTKIFKPGTSFNSAGVASPLESTSLVKRLIGVRPARTKVEEYWDGTDMTLSKVPDGNYVFKIYASTITDAISTLDGAVAAGTLLADDIVTSNIPVTKGGTGDLCGDFTHDTFFAPNPYEGEAGWFRIPILMNGRATVKIYNLAGDLVYKKDYGVRGGGDNIDGHGKCAVTHTNEACWPRVNSYGRALAAGVYFAVIRFEATEGTRDVCQTVKKILLP